MFKIVSESAVAAGVRRIEAVTGAAAEEMFNNMQDVFTTLKSLFNNTPDLAQSITKLIAENDSIKKNVEELLKERAVSIKNNLLSKSKTINGYNVITLNGPMKPDMVKNIAFMLKNETSNTIFAAATSFEDKPTLTLMYTDDLVKNGFNAGKDVREAAKLINGGGGGQPSLASAGGRNIAGLSQALEAMVNSAVKE